MPCFRLRSWNQASPSASALALMVEMLIFGSFAQNGIRPSASSRSRAHEYRD
jgi:hypothetical protein